MHKTVNISIGNALFTIEESAYKSLEMYLDSIRTHFGHTAEADEIVEDIEGRVAEALTAKLSSRKKVILIKDVEAVVTQMGTVEDFKEFEGEKAPHTQAEEDWVHKLKRVRLYRDADDQIIGGVCSGIAKYFDIDPIIIRLAFALSLLMGGFGFVLYLVLWFLLPEARTTTEKVEMTGGRVTLSAIQKRIDETIPPEKRKTILHKVVAFPFVVLRTVAQALAKVIRFAGPLLARLVGVIVIVGCSLAIAALTFVLFAILVNPASPYIGFPLHDVITGTEYITLFASAYFVILLPVLLILIFGASLVSLRNAYTFSSVAGMLGILFVAVMIAGVTLFNIAPRVQVAAEDYWNVQEATISRSFDYADFSAISVRSNVEFSIAQGSEYSIQVDASDKAHESVSVRQEDGMLIVEKNDRNDPCIILCPDRRVHLTVTMPTLSELHTDGISRGTVEGFEEESLVLDADGVTVIHATVNAKQLDVRADGVAQVWVTGSGTTLNLDLNGIARFHGYDFSVQTATVDLDGPVRAMINARERIIGEADGPARLSSKHSSATIEVNTHGPVRIEHDGGEDFSTDW